jgi:hypothetical protein
MFKEEQMRRIPLLMVFTMATLLSACGGSSGGGNNSAQREDDIPSNGSKANLIYDSELSPAEKTALDKSTSALASLPLDGSIIKRFSDVFGGDQSANVVSYFERRVNYALSGSTDINTRTVVINHLQESDLVASNIGTALWLESVVEGSDTTDIIINGQPIRVTSSRVGIMQFGDVFPQGHTVQQVNTLVHEARHSDCTGGVTSRDLESLRTGVIPENMHCGHFHVTCPAGHPYAGEFACDASPWGAYAVGAIHSIAVAQACSTCSETVKTIAEQEALDSLSRLLFNPEDMVNGKLGSPNMSSSDKVGN